MKMVSKATNYDVLVGLMIAAVVIAIISVGLAG